MLPLSSYRPGLACNETKVLELTFGSNTPATPVAFVERFCDECDCDCRRVTLQLVDLDGQEELAAVGYDFDVDLPPADDHAVYFERTSQNTTRAHLLRAIVEGLIRHTDYRERLEEHYAAFREAVDAGEEPEGTPDHSQVNGDSRPLDDYADRIGALSLDDHRDLWSHRAKSPTEINRILCLFVDARSGYGTAFDSATTILEGLDIEIVEDEIIEAAESASTTRAFPPSWRQALERRWTVERPLVEDILPLVAEALWARWADTPRPHLITKEITAGYDARYDRGPGDAWNHWKTAWRHIEIWLDARGGVADGETLTDTLDDALDTAESTRHWLLDVSRVVRELVRVEDDRRLSEECLDVLTSIASTVTDGEPVLLNNIDVTRYATLCDMGRPDDARRILAAIADRPTDDSYAGLFLADMIALWDYDPPEEDFELALEFIDRTLELADPDDGQLLRDTRNRLEDYR